MLVGIIALVLVMAAVILVIRRREGVAQTAREESCKGLLTWREGWEGWPLAPPILMEQGPYGA